MMIVMKEFIVNAMHHFATSILVSWSACSLRALHPETIQALLICFPLVEFSSAQATADDIRAEIESVREEIQRLRQQVRWKRLNH